MRSPLLALFRLLLCLLGLGLSARAHAAFAFTTWNGSVNTSWNTAGNWSNGLPNGSMYAVFDNAAINDCVINAGFSGIGIDVKSTFIRTLTNTVSFSASSLTISGGTVTFGPGIVGVTGPLLQNGGTFTAPSGTLNVSGDFHLNGGTFVHNNGTVALNGFLPQSLRGNGAPLYNLTLNGTGNAVNLNTSLGLAGAFNVSTAGISFNLNSFNLIVSGNIFSVGGASWSGTGALNANGAGSQSIDIGSVVPHFLHSGAGTATLANGLAVSGDVILNAGVLDQNGFSMSVHGAWSSAGGSRGGAGTVFLIGNDQTVSGNNSFSMLVKNSPQPSTLRFAAGSTQSVSGQFWLEGAPGQPVTLRSTAAGSPASINVTGTHTLGYLAVQDSNASGLALTAGNSTDLGNNTNWNFVAYSPTSTPSPTRSATPTRTATPCALNVTGSQPLGPGVFSFCDVHVFSGGTLTISGNTTIYVSGNFIVDAGGMVSGNGLNGGGGPPNSAGSGPGGGGPGFNPGTGGGGAGHGGFGGAGGGSPGGNAGVSYDNSADPIQTGSGGGGGQGGSGGFGGGGGQALKVSATGQAVLNGNLFFNGGLGMPNSAPNAGAGGGGSGGSISIFASDISGNGTLQAIGGTGASCGLLPCGGGGAGGGGRINLCSSGVIAFSGAAMFTGGNNGTGNLGNGLLAASGSFNSCGMAPTATPTRTRTATPTASPSPSVSETPSASPSATPSPTNVALAPVFGFTSFGGNNYGSLDLPGKKLGFRWPQRGNKVLDQVGFYVFNLIGSPPQYQVAVYPDDNGSPAAVPLHAFTSSFTPGWNAFGIPGQALQDGAIYHLVVEAGGTPPDPSNYMDVLFNYGQRAWTIDQVYDPTLAAGSYNGSWGYAGGPVFTLHYADSSVDGNGFHTFGSDSAYGAFHTGQRFRAPAGGAWVHRVGAIVNRTGSPPDDLHYRLVNVTSPQTLDQGVFASAGAVSGVWIDADLNSPVFLNGTDEYRIEFSSPGSNLSNRYFLSTAFNGGMVAMYPYTFGGAGLTLESSGTGGASFTQDPGQDAFFRFNEGLVPTPTATPSRTAVSSATATATPSPSRTATPSTSPTPCGCGLAYGTFSVGGSSTDFSGRIHANRYHLDSGANFSLQSVAVYVAATGGTQKIRAAVYQAAGMNHSFIAESDELTASVGWNVLPLLGTATGFGGSDILIALNIEAGISIAYDLGASGNQHVISSSPQVFGPFPSPVLATDIGGNPNFYSAYLNACPQSCLSPTSTATMTASGTPSFTGTVSGTPSATPTPSASASATPSGTVTLTASASATLTDSPSPSSTRTATATPSSSPSATPTGSPSASPTASGTASPSATATPSHTVTLTASASATRTDSPSPSSTLTVTATPSLSGTATLSPSGSPTKSPTPSATQSATPSVSATASATSSLSPSGTPTKSSSASPTLTAASSATFTRTATATPSHTALPSASPSFSATRSASLTPTLTPVVSATSTSTITETWTASETPLPTSTPQAPAVLDQNVFRPDKGRPLRIGIKSPQGGRVTVRVFNVAGEKVRAPFEADVPKDLTVEAVWDGRNEAGELCGSGVYIISVKGAGISRSLKLVLLK